MVFFRNKIIKRTLYGVLGLVGLAVVVVYVIVPIVFLWFPGIMRSFILVPDEEIPQFVDYDHPEKVGFVGAKNFYVNSIDGAKIGVWHTLPSNLEKEVGTLNQGDTDSTYREWLSNSTVFLYLHGSAGTRTSSHRLRVYRMLNKLNYHVVAFDYRGYGDSTGTPTSETDLVNDAKAVYTWIRERVTSGNIFLWGHSLGTGVGSHLANTLVDEGEPISGVVLEAPFDNMADAVRANHLAKIVSIVPWFDYCFIDPLVEDDMEFISDEHLKKISTPVLILHAKDDNVVPYYQGVKLYEEIASSRKDPTTVRLVSFDASLGYGHYNIAQDAHLNVTISQFVDNLL